MDITVADVFLEENLMEAMGAFADKRDTCLTYT